MELSMDSVVNKLIVMLICVSAVIAAGGAVFYYFSTVPLFGEAVPFAVGVAFALASNIIKVLLLKRAITKVTQNDNVNSAKIYFSVQYFLRMTMTGAALVAAALLPDSFVSLLGAAIGVFAHPIAMHILRFFVPSDAAMAVVTPSMPEVAEEGGE